MFSMRRFCALFFMLLMWVNLAWAETTKSYYVTATGDGATISYVEADGLEYDKANWTGTVATGDNIPTTLTALVEQVCYGTNGTPTADSATFYLKSGTYNVNSFIHIQGKAATNVYEVYGGFSGTESSIDDRDTATNETILDGSALTSAKDSSHTYAATTHLSSIIYINMSTYKETNDKGEVSCYRNDQDTFGTSAIATVTLDGLTIQNGGKNCSGNIDNDSFAAVFFGGGIRIEGGNVTINNCDIKGNKSVGSGAGIYIDSDAEGKCVTTITNCNITGNTAAYRGGGGGICVGSTGNDKGNVVIENCNISNNKAGNSNSSTTDDKHGGFYGGGIFIWYGPVTISNSTITNNNIYGNRQNNNYGGFGGGVAVYSYSAEEVSEVTITNCTIANNTADKTTKSDYKSAGGGGIWISANSSAIVTNCTFVGNSASDNGNEFRVRANCTKAEIINSLIWNGTTTSMINLDEGATATFTDCAFPTGATLPTGVTAKASVATNWEPTKAADAIATVNGITHTVYRIEDNTALASLAGAGTPLDDVKTDQLGNTRNAAPSIGAVEKVETPVLDKTTTLSITATEGKAITEQKITATTGEDIVWTIDKALPSGLTATSEDKTFTISGTPAVGTASKTAYSFTVTATNGAGSTTATVKITINAVAPILDPKDTITKTFIEGTAIDTITIKATSGDNLEWSTTGTLPSGLTGAAAEDKKSYTISGNPAKGSKGSYEYTVTAAAVTGETASVKMDITVNEALALTISEKTINATEGTAIESVTISSNTNEELTWSSTGSLPSGITGAEASDKKSFTISGAPAAGSSGSSPYTYTLTGKNSGGESAIATITIAVTAAVTEQPAATVTAPVLDTETATINATEGSAIDTLKIKATAGDNLTWTTSGDLPSGITGTASSDKTGFTISGTPATGTAGSYTYTITAANTQGSAKSVIKITVTAKESEPETKIYAPVLSSTDMKITATEGGAIRSLTIRATSGDNLAWSATGALPDGLTGTAASDRLSFTISGTPKRGSAGKYAYTVTAKNDAGTASAKVSVTVEKAAAGGSEESMNDQVTNGLEELAQNGEQTTLEDALKNQLGLSEEELKNVTSIKIPDNITDLGDLSALLPNLEKIDLTGANSLETVDLKGNTSLKEVTLTGNTSVKTIDLSDCGVTHLDASGCTALEEVNVAGNENIEELIIDECTNIDSLNAAGCTNLKTLSLSDCGNVSELNLDGCVNLEDLSFDGNAIKRFDGRAFPKLRQSKKLNAYGQRVRDIKFSRRFSFIDFFMNMLFNSDVSVSDISVNVSVTSGDKNVENIIARDSSGSKITVISVYDPVTGEIVFAEVPASIEYEYDTGIDSPDSMDITISGEAVDGGEDFSLGGSSSSGGCSTGFASLALLVLAGFVFNRKR